MAKSTWSPKQSLTKLEIWTAKIGGRLKKGAPLSDAAIDAIASTIKPYFGSISFRPPPSYRAFLKTCSSLALQVEVGGDWETVTELTMYSPKEMKKVTRETVHMPKGVGVGSSSGQMLSTNHLIGFAGTSSSPDCTYCFDTRKPNASGEYPIVFHDQDEPVFAVVAATGAPWEKKTPKPVALDFGSWFDKAVTTIIKKKASQLDV